MEKEKIIEIGKKNIEAVQKSILFLSNIQTDDYSSMSQAVSFMINYKRILERQLEEVK